MKEQELNIRGFENAKDCKGERVYINIAQIEAIHADTQGVMIITMNSGNKYYLENNEQNSPAVLEPPQKRVPKEEYAFKWRDAHKEFPSSDDEKVIVCTNENCIYVSSTIDGKFMGYIDFWMQFPPIPERK